MKKLTHDERWEIMRVNVARRIEELQRQKAEKEARKMRRLQRKARRELIQLAKLVDDLERQTRNKEL